MAKFDLRGGVSAGTVLGGSLHAMQKPVLGTQASVVLLTAALLGMCNRIAKLIARTASISHTDQDGEPMTCIEYLPEDAQEAFDRDATLLEDWCQALVDFAMDPERPQLGRTYALIGLQMQLWGQVLGAMELFVVGHEYGHHLARHGVDNQDSSVTFSVEEAYAMELQADRYGALLAGLASMSEPMPNMYALSCAAPLAVLTVLEYAYRGHSLLTTGKRPFFGPDTHPPLEQRADALRAAIPFLVGADASVPCLRIYDNIAKTLERVWTEVEPELIRRHDAFRPPMASGADWLPG
jgi:hypothetical protein